jgi:hypothetical protein
MVIAAACARRKSILIGPLYAVYLGIAAHSASAMMQKGSYWLLRRLVGEQSGPGPSESWAHLMFDDIRLLTLVVAL